ncbi:MAG: glycosyltransferase [Gemmatimonadetes bacterium]|nr:glycosyltransferase [Gemmatimonadota bacterium]
MKIGLVVVGGLARDPAHGAIPALHWLVECLARGHDLHGFTLYGAPRPERYQMLGATIHHAGAPPVPLRVFLAIVAEHRRSPFDLLHAFWLVPGGAVAAMAGRVLGVPVLAHAAGGEFVAFPDIGYGHQLYWKGRLWARIALAGARRISAASAGMIEPIERLGYHADRIPLGVDVARWPPVAPRPRDPASPARIVHVASLNRVKDQITLLRAARRLADQSVDFRLDIAGADTLHGVVEQQARELGLGDRICFHGFLPHERLHQLVRSADLLWISSRHEAGPLAVLEAAVVGVPAVGTAVGHIAEWAPDAAVAVPVGDAEALARETVGLLRDDDRRMALASEAQRRALAQDADWTAARFEQIYAETIAATRKGRG